MTRGLVSPLPLAIWPATGVASLTGDLHMLFQTMGIARATGEIKDIASATGEIKDIASGAGEIMQLQIPASAILCCAFLKLLAFLKLFVLRFFENW